MRLSPGTRLGPYEIVSPLGAGGMGEVYRAKDTRLGRDVAVKVLPEHLTGNPEVRTRFEREARTISSLSHPHICTLHDVGRAPGEDGAADIDYLVMELIEGETLAARIARGPMAFHEILKLATQIADALDRAHRAGIVHRDFKPGNVMITRSGAKLMDFGLARTALAGATPGTSSVGVTVAHLTQTPTMASPLTQQGSLIGTFLYMAPEQLEGKEADARSDLWAFGCVLYEMATGRRAFNGKSQASLIGAIMSTEPQPISATSSVSSPALDALVRACLVKDPEERIQTAHDIKLQLSFIAQSGEHSGTTGPITLPKPRRHLEPVAWAVAALAVAAAVFFAIRSGGVGRAAEDRQIAFTIPIPRSLTPLFQPRLSPDGKLLAFVAQDSLNRAMIWLRPMNALTANPIPGTENCRPPWWSPDSRFLAFIADGKLKKVAVAGGPAQAICDAPTGSDGTWSKDDVILFDGAGADPIYRVNAAGGVKSVAVPGDSVKQVGWPAFLPDGKHFFFSMVGTTGIAKTFVGTLGSAKFKELAIEGSRVEYSPDGYVLLSRDRTLVAQRFDAGALELRGEPFPVAENLPIGSSGIANFTISNDGILVYRASSSIVNRLVWLSRTGQELSEVAPAADFRAPALSPDGSKVAIRRSDPDSRNLDIWVIDLARGTTTRFSFDPADDGSPIWSPDGSKVGWTGGGESIRMKSANGAGEEEKIAGLTGIAATLGWSADGNTIFYQGYSSNLMDVFAVDLNGDRKPRTIVGSRFVEGRAQLSPDGHWLAYQSDESGRPEVYVVSYPGGGGKWQISSSSGLEPCWSRDGRELFYLGGDGRFMSTPIPAGPGFNPGTPQPLFRVQFEPGSSGRRNVYCPSPDGKKFLFLVPAGQNETPMTALVNWRGSTRRK
jgi:serine/threonine protein kinase/Tol biopolymer transport system component